MRKKIFVLLTALAVWVGSFAQNQKWEKIGGGGHTTGEVDNLGNYYILTSTEILLWNGSDWSPIGRAERAKHLAIDNKNNVYVANTQGFPSINKSSHYYLGKWDVRARTWTALPPIVVSTTQDGQVYHDSLEINCLTIDRPNNYLYAGTASGVFRANLNITSSSWTNLNKLPSEPKSCTAINIAQGVIYASFSDDNKVYKYAGARWTALGEAWAQAPVCLKSSTDGKLYAWSFGEKIGTSPINNFAVWDGSSWASVGTGLTFGGGATGYGFPCTFTFDASNNLYLGWVEKSDKKLVNGMVKRSAGTSTWTVFTTGMESDERDNLQYFGSITFHAATNYLYALNGFGVYRCYLGAVSPPNVPKITWTSLGSVVDPDVGHHITKMMLDANDRLYICGKFNKIGTFSTNSIARWTASKWEAFGAGLHGKGVYKYDLGDYPYIHDMELDNSGNLYVGGSFNSTNKATVASNDNIHNLGKWNGTQWEIFGKSKAPIYALTIGGDGKIYFINYDSSVDRADTENADPYLQAFDPASKTFSAVTKKRLLMERNSYYRDCTNPDLFFANGLYCTGNFIKFGSTDNNAALKPGAKDLQGFASWNGTEWTSPNLGFKGPVYSAESSPDNQFLLIRGWFFNADGLFTEALKIKVADNTWSAFPKYYKIGAIFMSRSGVIYGQVSYPQWGPDSYLCKFDPNNNSWAPLMKYPNLAFLTVDSKGNIYGTDGDEIFMWNPNGTSVAGTSAVAPTVAPTTPSLSPTSGRSIENANQYLYLQNGILTGLNSGTAITIEYWFKGSNLQSAVRMQQGANFIVAGWGASNPQHIISTDGGTTGLKIKTKSGGTVNDNQWHHIAMTWEKGKTDGFKSYVDGELIEKRNSSTTANLPRWALDGMSPVVGAYMTSKIAAPSEGMNGTIGRIRIWKEARTQEQLKADMGKSTLSATANLLYQSNF